MSTDHHLDKVAIRQLTWKPSTVRNIAVAIVRHALMAAEFYADEVAIPETCGDSNCIGTAWRLVTRAGIITPTGRFRRSERDSARGRKVFAYRLESEAKGHTFLARNGTNVPLVSVFAAENAAQLQLL